MTIIIVMVGLAMSLKRIIDAEELNVKRLVSDHVDHVRFSFLP